MDITTMKLTELIASGETESVEFKEKCNDEAIETIGAFSNAKGGTILIGVEDSGRVTGFKLGKKSIEDIANRIQYATDPRLQPSISSLSYGTMSIIAIQVTAISGVPVSVRGRYFRRVGKTNQRMSHEEIMQRMILGSGLSWDAMLEPSATLNDLDKLQIEQFINNVKNKGRFPIPKQTNLTETLRKLHLIRDNTPTRAALLLFGKKPETFFSSAFLKLGRFRSLTHIVDDREIHGPLFEQVDNTMTWFRERLQTEFIITDTPTRDVIWEYPLKAIREAITNAVCHRDYTSLAHSQIKLYDERLEIKNAGNLPTALTPELLLDEHDSMPRNRKIAEAFFYAGFIERWGSGTLRIKEELASANLPPPKFESNAGHFKIIIHQANTIKHDSALLIISHRQEKALNYIDEHGSITTAQYQKLTHISKSTALRDLNKLVNEGKLTTSGTASITTSYRLVNAK